MSEITTRAAVSGGDAAPTESAASAPAALTASTTALALGASALLAACGGGGGGAAADAATAWPATAQHLAGAGGTAPAAPSTPPSLRDAARFLTQASFGPRSVDEVEALRSQGFERWLWAQAQEPTLLHLSYIENQRSRETDKRVTEEMSYEAVWQQWLTGSDPLRARVSWALLQIFVISNIAPDIRPHAMSSYLDMLNRNALGNYRQLLEDVTLHPAMGYYLNLQGSEKEDPDAGTHPNENYAREVLQLFSIGLVKLNADGSSQGTATYGEDVVKGFAQAFSGWSFGGVNNANADNFHGADENDERLWTRPMQPWAQFHATGPKLLLDGVTLPAGGTPQSDMQAALDNIFNHPNVGPFIGRQLIQRLVTSNPSAAYIARVAGVFNDNGSGVRGDLKAVVHAILLDAEARGDTASSQPRFGKAREPVLRFAHVLRALGAKSENGRNNIHYLDSADDGLGQSPLLAPSVFNFYSPNYRPAGPLATAGMVAPEFQITSETSLAGSLNFFSSLFYNGGYGWGPSRLEFNWAPLRALATDIPALIDRLDLLFFNLQMSASTRSRMTTLLAAISENDTLDRVQAAMLLTALSPDHVIQK
jgi:uncharacterized protein (DUF1800 family)